MRVINVRIVNLFGRTLHSHLLNARSYKEKETDKPAAALGLPFFLFIILRCGLRPNIPADKYTA
jgi:hypothetical protein